MFKPFVFAAIVAWVGSCWFASVSKADETLGQLSVSSVFLEPQFVYSEPSHGAFEVGKSFLAVEWNREPSLSAVLKVGSRSLIGTPARYGPAPIDQLALIEGYAQLDTEIGSIRGGLVPIEYSLEGGDTEERLRFPRSLLYDYRFVNLRDYGASYHMSTGGFYSDWAVHNGEGGTDFDNRMWFTFRAGFQNGRSFKLGLSGSTGSTTPSSTARAGVTLPTLVQAGFDPTQAAKVRLANLFSEGTWERLTVTLEATLGSAQQDSVTQQLKAGHIDADYNFSDTWSLLARYDLLDPTSASNDRIENVMAGVALKSIYENSVLYLFGSRLRTEGDANDTHRILLIWRMTPFANAFRSPL